MLLFFTSRDQGGGKDNESSSSIIFAELTPEKEKPLGESGVKKENNNLVSYTANLVISNSSESESSMELQDGLTGLSLRPVVKHQLPLGHSSELEGNFASSDESSEGNVNVLGPTEVESFQSPGCVRLCLCVACLLPQLAPRCRSVSPCAFLLFSLLGSVQFL